MQLPTSLFLFVIQISLCHAFGNCTSKPIFTIPGRKYFYAAMYPAAFDMETYNATWYRMATEQFKTSPNLKRFIGLLEFYVCDDIDIARKSILHLLLDSSFVDAEGNSLIISIDSYLSNKLSLAIADILLPFKIILKTYSKYEERVDPGKYPNYSQININSFVEKVVSILKKFHLNNIVFISFVRSEDDNAFKDVWLSLIEENLEMCVQRYNILYSDTARMIEVMEMIKANLEQKIIICYGSQDRYNSYFLNLVNVSQYLRLKNRNWISNLYSAGFTSLYNETVDMIDGGINIPAGYIELYSSQYFSYYSSRHQTIVLNNFARMFWYMLPIGSYRKIDKSKNTFENCYYTNTSSGESTELEVNKALWRTCTTFSFDDIPDRIQWGAQNTVPPITRCNRRICPAGYTQVLNVSSDTKMNGRKYWTCIACTKGTINRLSGKGDCIKCTGLTVSNEQRTECYDPYRNTFLAYNSTHGKIILAVSVAGAVTNSIIAATFLCNRETPIVRSSNLLLTSIQQSAHFILFVSTPVLFVGEPILLQCQLRHITVGILLTIICSCVFVKIQKLMFIFHSKIRLSDQEKVLATLTDMFWILLLALIQSLSAIISLANNPAEVLRTFDKKTLIRKVYCNTGSHLNLQFLCSVIVMLVVVVQGLRAWKLPSFFNDTKLITVANLISVLMSGCMIPLYYSASDERVEDFLQVMLVLCCNSFLLVVMYGTKTYVVLFKPEKNTKAAFRVKMQQHSQEQVNSSLQNRK